MVAITNLALAAGAALLPRQNTPCSFVMTAVGDPAGQVLEDTIGENRIGGGFPQGRYYIDVQGNTLHDARSHNCVIDPDSFQFLCTQGASGLTDFSVTPSGNLMHQACENFVACPATGPGEDGSWNIFSDALQITGGCETVTLRTGGYNCTALGRPDSSSSATPVSTGEATIPTATGTSPSVTPFTTSAPAAACPTDLSKGEFQFPHLIVPTSPKAADHAFGNSLKAYITPINTTLFNFDIPTTYTGTCSLIFLFPYKTDLDANAGGYTFSGTEEEVGEKGGIDFALLSGIATAATTYASTPSVATDYGKTQIIPGNNYTVATYPCKAGPVTYSATSVGNVELDYFQDSAPMPIGLYIVPCV